MSSVTYLVCGVLQGSVLAPILFILYTVDLLRRQRRWTDDVSPLLVRSDIEPDIFPPPASLQWDPRLHPQCRWSLRRQSQLDPCPPLHPSTFQRDSFSRGQTQIKSTIGRLPQRTWGPPVTQTYTESIECQKKLQHDFDFPPTTKTHSLSGSGIPSASAAWIGPPPQQLHLMPHATVWDPTIV